MRVLEFNGPGQVRWRDAPDVVVVESGDAASEVAEQTGATPG